MAVKSEFSLEYAENFSENNGIPVIIVAGGNSIRMKGIDKITASLGGIPVIVRTMQAFERSEHISEIIVVIKEEKFAVLLDFAKRYMITKFKGVAPSGNCRAESVSNGLKLVPENTDFVLIHDGARPFVGGDLIERVVTADKKHSCVICANKCTDTIKRVIDNVVKDTFNRSELVGVQTPQRLDFKKYSGYVKNIENLESATDDASIMEKFGEEVFVVEGDYKNIKITSPLDLKIAQVLLEECDL